MLLGKPNKGPIPPISFPIFYPILPIPPNSNDDNNNNNINDNKPYDLYYIFVGKSGINEVDPGHGYT